ncbi:MAG: transposase [Actinomycetota bacterium]|nr:transposase [Actinomycetota bacterium]MDQ3437052.1 transposase [Actinomycetota bacterium]
MKRAYVYKLRPNRSQLAKLEETLDTCRHLYNDALAERKEVWESEQRSVGFAAQCASLTRRKKSSRYLPSVHSQVLQNVLRRVDRSFQNFFRRCKAGDAPGYPRFKGRGWYDSFCYPQYGNGARFKDGRLVLSKVGHIKVFRDRPLEGRPKTATIIRKADGWYVSVVCEVEPEPLPKTGESVGVDVGITHFGTLSTGEAVENPRCYRRAERRLVKAQRRVSRRKKGSKRREKAKALLGKAHQKVARSRRDHAHKTAKDLVERYDRIAVEDLNVSGMVKNHHLAKAISDSGWTQFVQTLSDKAEKAGRELVKVNPRNTSQACSGCGELVRKSLAMRWHSCPSCGCELDRDVNAAINILNIGSGRAFGDRMAVAAGLNREPHVL